MEKRIVYMNVHAPILGNDNRVRFIRILPINGKLSDGERREIVRVHIPDLNREDFFAYLNNYIGFSNILNWL